MASKQNVTGKDLHRLGYRPAKWWGPAIEEANRLGLPGSDLAAFLQSAAPKVRAPLEPGSRPLHVNLHAESLVETTNVDAVVETMQAVLTVPTALRGAVMPDACPAGPVGTIPVGGVVVTHDAIHPGMHSADICCSVMMTSLGNADPRRIIDAAQSVTHFGGGGREDRFSLPTRVIREMRGNRYLRDEKSIALAYGHLGTQGDGNHFLYVGTSEHTGETVLVTHHGSRGLGAYLYDQGMRVAETFRRDVAPQVAKQHAWLPFSEALGQDYWEALQIVRVWTKCSHGVLHDAVATASGASPTGRFWNEHNFVFRDGDEFYHAKGATPLDDRFVPDSQDGLRLVPLNMAEPILVVRGSTTRTNLGFAPHGAGRNASRSAHRRSLGNRAERAILAEETAGIDVRFYSGVPDVTELPSAYKSAAAVQRQMREYGLGEVVDRIFPYGCIMAGDWKRHAPWRRKRG